MPIRYSFAWWCFSGRGVPEGELLRGAKALGYDAVELIEERLFDAAREANLDIAAHVGHQSIASGLNDPAQHTRIEAEIRDALALAVRWGIPNLIVFSGERRPGLSEEQGAHNTAQGLRRVAAAAEDAGVTLILELLNSKVDHPGYQADHTDWAVSVCEQIGSPRVKLLYDIYHMQIMEGDIIRTLQNSHAYFGHYHTAGVPGRHDIDDRQELNYPAILRALVATGYVGYVAHEFIPQGDPLAALAAALQVGDMPETSNTEKTPRIA